jgi:hypothetical protein
MKENILKISGPSNGYKKIRHAFLYYGPKGKINVTVF